VSVLFERRLRRRNRFAGQAAAGDRWGVSGGATKRPECTPDVTVHFERTPTVRSLVRSLPGST